MKFESKVQYCFLKQFNVSNGFQELLLGVKAAGSKADHFLPSGADANDSWSYISTTPYVSLY
jgi:hypothetical protein